MRRRKKGFLGFLLFPFVLLWSFVMLLIQFIRSQAVWLASIGVIAMIFLSVRSLLYADPYFNITSIRVYPNGVLTQKEYVSIEKACQKAKTLQIDINHLAQIAKTNPRVKQAVVSRSLPNEINIYLTLRKPMIQLQVVERGPFYLLSDDGTVMGVNTQPELHYVLLSHYSYREKKLSLFDRYQPRPWWVVNEILEKWPQNEITKNETIHRISIDHLGSISIFLANGPELLMGEGGAEQLKKLSVVKSLFSGSERGELVYIDLRFSDVIVKKKN